MRNLLILLLYLGMSQLSANAQTVDECVDYIHNKGKDPKEYIFEKFKEVDVIILGERDHRDTTQYDFILDILRDSRFAEKIGYVYTEVGVTNMTEAANRLIKGNYTDNNEFHNAFLKFYRNLDYEPLWEKYNGYKFIKGLYDINTTLPTENKITWGLTDRPWNWAEATYESGEFNYYRVYLHRDKYMADNFLRLYKQQPLKDGHRKALVITNTVHALKMKKGKSAPKEYDVTTQGYHITKALGKGNVEILLFNYFFPDLFNANGQLYAEGMWDAAFELTGCKPVAVSFHDSPFGKYKDLGKPWSKFADGIIYYKAFYEMKNVIGIPHLLDEEFFEEYKRRDSITRNKSISLDFYNMERWYNTKREVPRSEFEKEQIQQMNKTIELYKGSKANIPFKK